MRPRDRLATTPWRDDHSWPSLIERVARAQEPQGTVPESWVAGLKECVRSGYGLGVFEGRYTATPELGLGLSDTDREVRLGWRLAWAYLWLDPASWRPGQRGHGTCRYRDECPPARRPGGEASEYRRVARPRHHWAHPSSGCADPC